MRQPQPAGARFCDNCGAPLEAAPADAATREPPSDLPESFADGRYRVQRFLGERGRKRVYLARDTAEDRDVALAVFETEGVEETVLATSRREVQAMRRLGDHPHVVPVLDTGEEDGRPYIASRYMPGGDVETALDGAEIAGCRLSGRSRLPPTCAGHSSTRTRAGSSTATSSPPTCGSPRTARPGSATSDSPRPVTLQPTMEGMLVGTVAYLPPSRRSDGHPTHAPICTRSVRCFTRC